MTAWCRRHPVLTWAVAWGVTGMGLFIAGIADSPRQGPLWVGIVCGTLAWAWAGALTFQGSLRLRGLLVWGLTYGVAFGLAELWAWGPGGDIWPGWGTLLAWSLGTTLGPLLSGGMETIRRPRLGSALLAIQWGFTTLAGALVGIVGAYLLGAIVDVYTGSYGHEQLLVTFGVGLGASIGGLVVGAVGLTARDRIIGALAVEAASLETS